AVFEAIFNLADPRPDHRWALDGTIREVQIGRSRVTLRLENEATRVNPNLASAGLLEALLLAIAVEPERSFELADAIAEWAGTPTRLHEGTTLAQYQAAGLNYLPPRAPLESLEELGRVRGMTQDLLAALRPHLTLFGPAEPAADSADQIVATAIALTHRAGA